MNENRAGRFGDANHLLNPLLTPVKIFFKFPAVYVTVILFLRLNGGSAKVTSTELSAMERITVRQSPGIILFVYSIIKAPPKVGT